jgi:hypothetical protein
MIVVGAEIKNHKYQVTTRNTCTLDAKLLKSATIEKLRRGRTTDEALSARKGPWNDRKERQYRMCEC